jgi:drebrin-like protein
VASSTIPTKPSEDDRIAPVGTAYTPVALPPPKKLKNPFAAFEQGQSSTPQVQPASGGAKKLTWSERQALAKKQAAEEEAASRSAGFVQPVVSPTAKPTFTSSAPAFGRATAAKSAPRNFGAVPAAAGIGMAAGVGVAAGASRFANQSSGGGFASARAAVVDAAWGTDEGEQEQLPHVSLRIDCNSPN